jgi:hypothetical protein
MHAILRTEATQKYRPEPRKCRFHGENPLERFKDYSQFNCEMERVVKLQEKICGCTDRFWYGDYPWCENMTCLEGDEYIGNVFNIIMFYEFNFLYMLSKSRCPL